MVIAWTAIVLGVFFRLAQLPTRILFIDEAVTLIRVAGHTDDEMTRALYDGRSRTVETMRRDAIVTPESSPPRLITSLIEEDAQHPPLFYLAELGMVRSFGNSLLVWRFLPALFGLLTIPAAYALARELFSDHEVGLVAAALFAVSPIERVYAQQAREYALLTLFVLLATAIVARAVRTNGLRWWALYAVLVAAGLYTSPFMGYVVAAHAVFVISGLRGNRGAIVRFAAAAAIAVAVYVPWLDVLATHRGVIVASNTWSATRWPVSRLLAKWAFNTGSTFFDLEYVDLRWTVVLAIVAVVAAVAIWRGFRAADVRARWCLGAAIVVPAVLLCAPDLLLGQHRSAVARYGLPVFAMLPILVARGVAGRPLAATVLLVAGAFACAISSTHSSWWDNDTNADDGHIAAAINAVPSAQVISTLPPGEFIPFAVLLRNDIRVSLSPGLASAHFAAADPLFVLQPSADDLQALRKRTGFTFDPVAYVRAMTAHDIGAHLANGGDDAADTDLYRAAPGK